MPELRQMCSDLSAGNIDYRTLKAYKSLKLLKELEKRGAPSVR